MFKDMFSSQGVMPSIILDHETHYYYTSEWRKQFPYGSMDYSDSNYRNTVMNYAYNLYGMYPIGGGGGCNEDDLDVDLVE